MADVVHWLFKIPLPPPSIPPCTVEGRRVKLHFPNGFATRGLIKFRFSPIR